MAELVSIKRNVDVSPGQAAPAVFHCSQGDVGSKIILGLLNNGTAYSIPSGVTVTIEGSESNGSIFTPISATASGSDITFYLTGEMTAVAGPAICQAVLKSGSNILGTANFTLEVESSPMGADAPPVFTDAGWTWMLNKLSTEFVPALDDNIIDAIDSKADQSDLETLESTVAGELTDIKADLSGSVSDLKNAVSEVINLVPPRLRNNGSANGITLTVNNDGSYTVQGTCTNDVRFDLFSNGTSLPSWLEYSQKYFVVGYGRQKAQINITSIIGGITNNLAVNPDVLSSIDLPASGGFRLSITCLEGVTYDETINILIANDTQTLTGAYSGLKSYAMTEEMANLLTEIPSTTVNGLELTNVGNGQYTLIGTATADTNITFFTSVSEVPDYLKRGGQYCATLQGAKAARFIVTTRPGYTSLATVKNYLAKFEVPSDGGMMIALNLDVGMTYNEIITPIIVRDGYFPHLYLPKKTIVVSNDVAEGDFGKIRDAVDYANQHKGTTIIIKEGSYDLVREFGKSYLDSLSDSNPDYGIYLGNDVKIICSPRVNIYFDYDGTNEWIVRYFSPFNTSNSSYEVVGMHITAHNCRYIVHDDPLWPDKTNFSHNVWRECYFEIFPSPQVASWVNHQIIGGGFGTNTLIEFDACIFNAHFSGVDGYSSLSYHNDVSGWKGSRSFLAVKSCYFADGNRVIIQGYGSSIEKSKAIIAGNSFENVTTDIVYLSSDADNIDVYQFNNQSR